MTDPDAGGSYGGVSSTIGVCLMLMCLHSSVSDVQHIVHGCATYPCVNCFGASTVKDEVNVSFAAVNLVEKAAVSAELEQLV